MNVMIVGAGGGIGKSLVAHYQSADHDVSTVSSQLTNPHLATSDCSPNALEVDWLKQPGELADFFSSLKADNRLPDIIVSCTGFLHETEHLPEKKLGELDHDFLMKNMELNCYSHVLLSQLIDQTYQRKDNLKFLCLSAKVGSISDNQLGGWYSYRMSKAALNMYIKTLSIEWSRSRPNHIVAALHPGTTDTSLSEPFQQRIAADKLYSSTLTAERIANVAERLEPNDSGKLLFWDGSALDY